MAQLNKLHVKEVKTLPVGMHGDGGGLWLQVQAKGQRSWAFRYISPTTRKPRQMGLGSADSVSLAKARDIAIELRRKIVDGIDPLDERVAAAIAAAPAAPVSVMTFAEVTESFMRAHRSRWATEKLFKLWQSTLVAYAYPVIGTKAVHAVTTADMMAILDPIWRVKSDTAAAVRMRVEAVLSYGYVHSTLPRPPFNPAVWRGNLDVLLPQLSRIKKVQHHPAMQYRDIPAFMAKLVAADTVRAKAMQFLILNACRSNEARLVRWPHIDLTAAVWNAPEELMKARRPHRFPLSPQAMQLLRTMPVVGLNSIGLIFMGAKKDYPMSQNTLAHVLDGLDVHGDTVHGFRSAFSDWAVEVGGYSDQLAEVQLAHSVKTATQAAYLRTDMLDLRRPMMNAWADYVMSGTQAMAVAA
jgi:integrase